VSWSRYKGHAPAEKTLTGAARDAELEGFLRLKNPQLTDIRLEHATATEGDDPGSQTHLQWYGVTYLADNGEGHTTTL
jgi:hypothetical protein